jgi:hypothetical protein
VVDLAKQVLKDPPSFRKKPRLGGVPDRRMKPGRRWDRDSLIDGEASGDFEPGCLSLRNCLGEGTEVETSEGPVAIEELEEGDQVWAWNEWTREPELAEVVRVFEREVPEFYRLYVGAEEVLEATGEHPFWVVGQGWVEVEDLRPGDVLRTYEGYELRLVAVEREERSLRVYNFEVRGLHTYFAGRNRVAVHNCSKINDEDFVRFDPSEFDSSIDELGIQKRFFADRKVWLAKYKDVKHLLSGRDLEEVLYRKNLRSAVTGKFARGATLRVVRNADDAVAAGMTNRANGIRQWRLLRDVEPSEMEVVRRLSPYAP